MGDRAKVMKHIPKKLLYTAGALASGWAASHAPLPGLSQAGKIGFGIFVVAILLWTTEAVPLFITSFVIVALEVITLGLPGGPLGFSKGEYAKFINPLFSPVIMLLLGGFALAAGLQKYGLGEVLITKIIAKVGNKPKRVILGAMAATAFLSMWISNTAATAAMIALIMPVIKVLPEKENTRKALVLGVAFSASVGGIATPIGTPPNAIAIGELALHGHDISFGKWTLIALPLCVLLFSIIYKIILFFFPPKVDEIAFTPPPQQPLTKNQKAVLGVGLLTALLWLTGPLHHIPSSVVALVPVLAFFGTGLLEKNDFSDLGWHVLIIVGGGLSLGVAMRETGLSSWLVSKIDLQTLPLPLVFVLIATATLTMATFISHSAVANLLIPIVIGFSSCHPTGLVVTCAMAASVGMALPVSTPPNAIAYGAGEVKIKDMALAGGIGSMCCAILLALYIYVLKGLL